jgi:hypothetical protein
VENLRENVWKTSEEMCRKLEGKCVENMRGNVWKI